MLTLLQRSTVELGSCAISGGMTDMLLLPKHSSVKFVTFTNSSAVRFQVEAHSWNGGCCPSIALSNSSLLQTRQLCDIRWSRTAGMAAMLTLLQRSTVELVSLAISGGDDGYAVAAQIQLRPSRRLCDFRWNDGYVVAAQGQLQRR